MGAHACDRQPRVHDLQHREFLGMRQQAVADGVENPLALIDVEPRPDPGIEGAARGGDRTGYFIGIGFA